MEKKLTVVIPVYKVEKYINKCLDSLILPDGMMEKLEVIIVNDGTPDNSAIMAKEYEKKYPQTFRVIDKENGGHGSAWNRGLKEAKGKYLKFLDSDDWFENFEQFFRLLEDLDVDLVYSHINKCYESSNQVVLSSAQNVVFNKTFHIEDYNLDILPNGFWYWTYKTEMLQKCHPLFVEHVFYDDAILFYAPYILGKTMCFLDLTLYNYRLDRPGQSVSIEVKKNHAKDYEKVSLSIIDFFDHHNMDLSEKNVNYIHDSISRYCTMCFNCFLLLNYNEFKKIMDRWLPIIGSKQYIKPCNRIKMYKVCPNYLGWLVVRTIANMRD